MDRIEQEKAEQGKAYQERAGKTPAPSGPCGIEAQTVKVMNARERLLNQVRDMKDIHLRKLVALQTIEQKIHRLLLSEAESVQEILELLAQN